MSFVYDALKKAEREGQVDSTWIPLLEKKPPVRKESQAKKQPQVEEKPRVTTQPRAREQPRVATASRPREQPRASRPVQKLTYEIVDNFTMLKQNVQLAHAEKGVDVIAITSSVPGEGCSTISYYLSLLLAQSIHHHSIDDSRIDRIYDRDLEPGTATRSGVLVIDGNLKNPGIYRLFGVDRQHGVNEFIVTDDGKKTRIAPNHFNFITSGRINGNWHDIWASERTRTLMSQLRRQFEYILIDAPPLIGHPDTLALSKLADGVLFVIKANQTRLEVIDEAKQRLKEAELNVLGVVLNERRFFIPSGIYRRI